MIFSSTQCAKAASLWSSTLDKDKFQFLQFTPNGYAFQCSREAYEYLKCHNSNSHFKATLGIFTQNEKQVLGLILYPLSETKTIDLCKYQVIFFEKIPGKTAFYDIEVSIKRVVLNESFGVIEQSSWNRSNKSDILRNMLSAESAVDEIMAFKRSVLPWVSTQKSKKIVRNFLVPINDLGNEFIEESIQSVGVFFGLRYNDIANLTVPNLLFVANQPEEEIYTNLTEADTTKPFKKATRDFSTPCPPFCSGK